MKNHLRIARAVAGMTQADLARETGVSRQTIHAVESGKYIPSTVLALKMALALKKSVQELFELEEADR